MGFLFCYSMNVFVGKLYKEIVFIRWFVCIRIVVFWFKCVYMVGVVLKEKLVFLELLNYNVIFDVKIRWNFMYMMVERFVEIYLGFNVVIRD